MGTTALLSVMVFTDTFLIHHPSILFLLFLLIAVAVHPGWTPSSENNLSLWCLDLLNVYRL